MSARQAAAASARLRALRGHLETLTAVATGRGGVTKTDRSRALGQLGRALREDAGTRAALTHFSARERAAGARENVPDRGVCPLGWAELAAEVLDVLGRSAEEEAGRAKAGSLKFVLECGRVFREIVGFAVSGGAAEALRDLVCAYFARIATWQSDVRLVELMDDAWLALQCMLEAPCLRAMLTPAYFKWLVNACFQQVAERGHLFRHGKTIGASARRVFVLLATEAPNCDVLLAHSSGSANAAVAAAAAAATVPASRSMSRYLDAEAEAPRARALAGYSLIMQRACLLLYLSREMDAGAQREVEATALAVLAAAMGDRALELHASAAVDALREYGAPAAANCWGDRRLRPHALAFVRVLVRLVPCGPGASRDVDLLRERVAADFAAYEGAAAATLDEPEADLVDVALAFYGVKEISRRLRRAANATAATAWLRVLHAALARRDNRASMACLVAVDAVVHVFGNIGGDARALPSQCAEVACRVLTEAAAIAACLPSARGVGRGGGGGGVGPVGESGGSKGVLGSGSRSHEPVPSDVDRLPSAATTGLDGTASLLLREEGFGSVSRIAAFSLLRDKAAASSSDCDQLQNAGPMLIPGVLWRDAYACLIRQLLRGRIAAGSTGNRVLRVTASNPRVNQFTATESAVLDAMTLLLSLGAVSAADAEAASLIGPGGGSEDLWSLALFSPPTGDSVTPEAVFSFMRTHLSVVGFPTEDGGSLKIKLVRMLLATCHSEEVDPLVIPSASALVNAASAALGLIRGSCRQETVLAKDKSVIVFADDASNPRSASSVTILDAVKVLFCHPDDTAGDAAVVQSLHFKNVKAALERVVFPAGGGWDERFLLSDRDLVPTAEEALRRTTRASRTAVDVVLQQKLESLMIHILTGHLKFVDGLSDNPKKGEVDGFPDAGDASSVGKRPFRRRRQHPTAAQAPEEGEDSCDEVDRDHGRESGDGSSEAPDFEAILKRDESAIVASATPVSSVPGAVVVTRVMLFLGEYLAEGIELGLLQMSLRGQADGNLENEVKIARLLVFCAARLAASSQHIVTAMETLELLPGALSACARVIRAILTRDFTNGTTNDSTLQKVSASLTEIVVHSLVNTLLSHTCSALLEFTDESIRGVKAVLSSLNSISVKNVKAGQKRKRSQNNGGADSRKSVKRSRGPAAKRSLFSESEDDGIDDSGFDDSHDDDDSSGFSDADDDAGRHGDESWDTPPRRNQPLKASLVADAVQSPVGSGSNLTDLPGSFWSRQISLLCLALYSFHSVLPERCDEMVNQFADCLALLASRENNLSPDNHRRDMLLCEDVCPLYFITRSNVWKLLLLLDTAKAAETAAEDIIRVAKKWSGAAELSNSLSNFYAEEYWYKKRSTIPTTCFLERLRADLFLFLARYFESCLGVGEVRMRLAPSERRLQVAQAACSCVSSLRKFNPSKLPRESKVALLHFAAVASEVVLRPAHRDAVGAAPYSDSTIDVCNSIQGAIFDMLGDADAQVRLTASALAPLLLRVGGTQSEAETGSLLEKVIENLPPALECRARSVATASEGQGCDPDGDGDDDDAGLISSKRSRCRVSSQQSNAGTEPSFLLSDDATDAALKILGLFENVGAGARGSSVYIALSEIGALCIAERGRVLDEFFSRASARCGCSLIAFGAVVRLAARAGYADPDTLFRAFRRPLLSMWLKGSNRPWRRLEKFPVTLVLPFDRFRPSGFYDWLHLHVDEILPLVLVSDSTSSLKAASELASSLDLELGTLIREHATCVYRLYVMHVLSSENISGKRLWDRVWNAAASSKANSQDQHVLNLASRYRTTEILGEILMSTSCGPLQPVVTLRNYNVALHKHEFRRDCSAVAPPVYDPLVCLLGMDVLLKPREANDTQALHADDLQGSIFARGLTSTEVSSEALSSFLKKKPATAASMLARIWQGMHGPPSPPSIESRQNSFMALGVLYRASRGLLLEECSLRSTFFDLIASGMCFPETARNARWLLQDVCENFQVIGDSHKFVGYLQSSHFGLLRSDATRDLEALLEFDTPKTQRWWEILERIVPSLVSVAGRTCEDALVDFARRTLRDLINAVQTQKAIAAFAVLDPLPGIKPLKAERVLQEKAFATLATTRGLTPQRILEYRLWRFGCANLYEMDEPIRLLARLRSLRETLERHRAVLDGLLHIKPVLQQGSSDSPPLIVQVVDRALRSLLLIIESCIRGGALRFSDKLCSSHSRSFLDRKLVTGKRMQSSQQTLALVEEEAVRCVGVLGMALPTTALLLDDSIEEKMLENSSRPRAHVALRLLCRELRSDSAIARQVAISTLQGFLSTMAGSDLYKSAACCFRVEYKLFVRSMKASQRLPPPPRRVDPTTGRECDIVLPALSSSSLWTPVQDSEGSLSSGVPSRWIRTLAAALARECDDEELVLLEAACFASATFSTEIFPHLLCNTVKAQEADPSAIAHISQRLRHDILENRAAPTGALRLILKGMDALCELGIGKVKSRTGVGKFYYKKDGVGRIPASLKEFYILTIPYLTVARAASRCGLYFSALRFATLHVDCEYVQRERQLRAEKSSWSTAEEQELEQIRERARVEAGSVITNSLKHLHEPDGQCAVSQKGGIVERTAVVASVEGNWPRMMGTLDVLQRSSACEPHNATLRPSISAILSSRQLSFARERDIFRSMIGLGALSSAVKYWQGLRLHVLENRLGSTQIAALTLGANETEGEAAAELVELRYEAAWKLGEWQTPPALPVHSCKKNTEGVGLHEALHSGLGALMCGDVASVLTSVDTARSAVACRMTSGLSGSLIAGVRDAAINLLLIEDLYLAATVLAQSRSDSIGQAARIFGGSSSGNASSDILRDGSSILRAGAHFKEVREGCGVQSVNLNEITGLPAEGDSDVVMDAASAVSRESSPVLARFLELRGIWERRDSFTVYSRQAGACSPATIESILSLRVAVAKALGVRPFLARMSAELATSILSADGGKGAWSRAASALGTFDSVSAIACSRIDIAAWRIAEARLCWQASEDGNSKQEALQVVKNVIANELGGVLVTKQQRSSEEGSPTFKVKWNPVDGEREGSQTLALLRADACCLASTWSAAMRAEEPMILFRGYFQMGLAAFPTDMEMSAGKCDAHYAMAEFADRQMMSIEGYRKTKPYEFKLQNVAKMAASIAKIEHKLENKQARDDNHKSALRKFVVNTQKDLERDNKKLADIESLLRKWQLLSAQNYAACLRSGSNHDLRAAFRLVYLWTEKGTTAEAMNNVMLSSKSGVRSLGRLSIPTNKLLPLAPQIASRIGKSGGEKFERTLEAVLTAMTVDHAGHCLWLLVALSNLARPVPSKDRLAALYVADQDKKDAADAIIASVRKEKRGVVDQTLQLANFYFAVSEIPKERRQKVRVVGLASKFPDISDLNNVLVPTIPLPLHGYSSGMEQPPTVVRFEGQATVLGGNSSPLRVSCIGSDGVARPQVVKYEEDMRQDAVMEQLFVILNELLTSNSAASVRNLLIRTYRIVPLSPFAGVMQFVRDTQALRDYLLGTDGNGKDKASAHARHRPHDLPHQAIIQTAFSLRSKDLGTRLNYMREVWGRFKPVMRYFFIENFPSPADLHYRRLAYTRSAAVMSIVGWLVGLGDRHLSNILIDCKSAELVHIDFGIAFEGGKLLNAPELMPFRLTRDVVDGMGIDGVEGVFRKSCEVTMQLLRENKDLILMVVDVFLHDPLYNWSFTPLRAMQDDRVAEEADDSGNEDVARADVTSLDDDDDGCDSRSGGDTLHARGSRSKRGKGKKGVGYGSDEDGNEKAMHAVSVISEKLEGLESTDRLSVEAHVARLIDEARAFDVIASAYCGWAPWV